MQAIDTTTIRDLQLDELSIVLMPQREVRSVLAGQKELVAGFSSGIGRDVATQLAPRVLRRTGQYLTYVHAMLPARGLAALRLISRHDAPINLPRALGR